MKITKIHAREVFDSRGIPTVGVEVTLDSGTLGEAIVPSGASVGIYEALELRDNDPNRFLGKGVLKAIQNVNETIAPSLIGVDISNQQLIDSHLIDMDGTENKSNLGANAILGVSLASAKAAAKAHNLPLYRYIGGIVSYELPLPMLSMIGGGAHAGWNMDFQDFMMIPTGARSFKESLMMAYNVYDSLKTIIQDKGFRGVADTGGFCPLLKSNIEGLDLLIDGIEEAGYHPGKDVCIGTDVASAMFYKKGKYVLRVEKKEMDSDSMIDFLEDLISKYPLISIEDGLSEEDWEGWTLLTQRLGKKVQLIGDDLFATNIKLLKKGIEMEIANAILVKLNQIGTLTETLKVVKLAKESGYTPVISRRSAETEDTTIADLAVATGAGQIKFGSMSRSEGLAKYNRLLKIEEELNGSAIYSRNRVLQYFRSK